MIATSAATAESIEKHCFIDSAGTGYKILVLTLVSKSKTVTQEWQDGYKHSNLAVFRNGKVTWNSKMDNDP